MKGLNIKAVLPAVTNVAAGVAGYIAGDALRARIAYLEDQPVWGNAALLLGATYFGISAKNPMLRAALGGLAVNAGITLARESNILPEGLMSGVPMTGRKPDDLVKYLPASIEELNIPARPSEISGIPTTGAGGYSAAMAY